LQDLPHSPLELLVVYEQLSEHPEYPVALGFLVLDPVGQAHADSAEKVTRTPVHLIQPAAPPPAAWADQPEALPSRRHSGTGEFNGNREL
jgi:hypothetical protein